MGRRRRGPRPRGRRRARWLMLVWPPRWVVVQLSLVLVLWLPWLLRLLRLLLWLVLVQRSVVLPAQRRPPPKARRPTRWG